MPPQFQADWQQAQAGEQRYVQRRDWRGLVEAASAWERIFQHPTFPNAPEGFQLVACNNGGSVFLRCYWVQGQLGDLNRALQLWQTAVQRTPPDSPDLPTRLNNLGTGLSARYARSGQLADLEEAIRVYQMAVQRTPPDSPDLPTRLNNLGTGLSARYARSGQLADLAETIRVYQTAVQRTSPDSPDLHLYLNNLGSGLSARYARSGQLADLEEAIGVYQTAVQRTSPDSPDLPTLLNNLGNGLSTRYARSGQLADLAEAIHVYQTAVQRTPPDSPNLPGYLSNLGTGLRTRYARSGQLADLEEAIGVYQTAVQRTPPDSPDLPRNLNNLGDGLRTRYARTGQLADLEEAIRAFQAAVQRTPPDSPNLPTLLNNLGLGLNDRYARSGQLADLEEAIGVYQTAVQRTSPDSPNLPRNLNNLGNGLGARYARTGQLADLEEAIGFFEAAVAATPPDSLDLPTLLNNLGDGLRDRYARTGQLADLEKAIRDYDRACQLGQEGQPEVAVAAARSWGRWALTRHAWAEAARAYSFGLVALEQLYRAQLLQHEQQSWLREGQGLYAQAAYAQGRLDDLAGAVTLLEQGQARAFNERLARDEADLRQVQQHAPPLFQRYQAAAERLRQLETSERQQRLTASAIPPDWPTHRRQVQQARDELQAVIAAIRQLPDHAQFLQPPEFTDVAAAVLPTRPLAYLVTTPAGSLALLLHRSRALDVLIEPLWADPFTEDHLNAFLVKRENDELQGGYLPGQLFGGAWLHAALNEGLPTLGEKLLAPLAHRLAELGFNRLTLIPGGRLNLLPLHAAHIPRNGRVAVFGEAVTISYAPSARALAASRRRLESLASPLSPSLLAVGNPLPLPKDVRSLRFARPEAEEIALRFGGTPYLYCETAATHAAVTAALSGTRYLHFACHGQFDVAQPLDSGLILSGGERLTLRQILDDHALSGARMAVLSACQTAITDYNDLPDEVIGLPAAFLQAGAVGVLGSLWPVNDLSTALFMDHFYRLHRDEGQEPTVALQATQHWLRHLTVASLGKLFADYVAAAPDAPVTAGRMAHALAEEKFIDFTLAENQAKTPFAAPFYWAAFAFYGL